MINRCRFRFFFSNDDNVQVEHVAFIKRSHITVNAHQNDVDRLKYRSKSNELQILHDKVGLLLLKKDLLLLGLLLFVSSKSGALTFVDYSDSEFSSSQWSPSKRYFTCRLTNGKEFKTQENKYDFKICIFLFAKKQLAFWPQSRRK